MRWQMRLTVLLFRAKRVFEDSNDPMADEAMQIISDLETARSERDDEAMQEKMDILSDLISKYETADY